MERQLAAQLGGQYNAAEDTVTFANPQAADRIIDRAETRYIEQVTDPITSRSPNVVIDEIVNKVISLVGTEGLQLKDIAAVDYFNTMPTPIVRNPEDTVPTSADEDIIEEETEN